MRLQSGHQPTVSRSSRAPSVMLPSLASSKQKRKASGSTYPSAPILTLMALTREKLRLSPSSSMSSTRFSHTNALCISFNSVRFNRGGRSQIDQRGVAEIVGRLSVLCCRPGAGPQSLYAAFAAINARPDDAETRTGETARSFCTGFQPAGSEQVASLSDEELVTWIDSCG